MMSGMFLKKMETSLPPSFFSSELRRALTEQLFGIESFVIKSDSVLESTAAVTLLEGKSITISLSSCGYHVSGHASI